jgi:hypothetical protein
MWVLAMAALTAPVAGASELTLAEPDGGAVRWSDWLAANGPAAILVWASWAPAADAAVDALDELAVASEAQRLALVVVAVQESAEAAGMVLGRTATPWLHDRHGAILKEYRLIRVPILVVVDSNGGVLAKLEPRPEALRTWRR